VAFHLILFPCGFLVVLVVTTTNMRLRVVEVIDLETYLKQDQVEGRRHTSGSAKTFTIDVPRSSTVRHVKQLLGDHNIHISFRGEEVPDDWPVCTNMKSSDCLVFTRYDQTKSIQICGLESLSQLSSRSQQVLKRLLAEVQDGLEKGEQPVLSKDGSGGTYFLKNASSEFVACFKPQDEEPSAENNPRGLCGNLGQAGLRQGVLSGEAVQREIAAFISDADGFSCVPETIMAEVKHPVFRYKDGEVRLKKGSLQKYVSADCIASDFSPNLFPVDEVHKIALLDIRLLNADRNDANLLVTRRPRSLIYDPAEPCTKRKPRSFSCSMSPQDFEYELSPIDHGYCLPDRLEVTWCDWCWLDWPQTRVSFSSKTLEWIRNYDVDANVDKLRRDLNVREPCLRLMKISGTLLKRGAAAGLCLHDIASIIVRQDIDAPSVLENQILRAAELAHMMQSNARVKGGGALVLDTHPSVYRTKEPLALKSPRSRRATLSSVTLPEHHDASKQMELPFVRSSSGLPRLVTTPGSEEGFLIEQNIALPVPRKKMQKAKRLVRGHNSDSSKPRGDPSRISPRSLDPGFQAITPTRRFSIELKEDEDIEQRAQIEDGRISGRSDEVSVMDDFDCYFFRYVERLIEDVIVCVQRHRLRDKSMFRRSSSLHLTSPHRSFDSLDPFPEDVISAFGAASDDGNLHSMRKCRTRSGSEASFFIEVNEKHSFDKDEDEEEEVAVPDDASAEEASSPGSLRRRKLLLIDTSDKVTGGYVPPGMVCVDDLDPADFSMLREQNVEGCVRNCARHHVLATSSFQESKTSSPSEDAKGSQPQLHQQEQQQRSGSQKFRLPLRRLHFFSK